MDILEVRLAVNEIQIKDDNTLRNLKQTSKQFMNSKSSRYLKEKRSNLGLNDNIPILLINFGIYDEGTLYQIKG